MTPIEESINLLKEIKTKGYNTFVLSNYHKEAFETVYSKYDFFRLLMECLYPVTTVFETREGNI